jgi:hypothetical protein
MSEILVPAAVLISLAIHFRVELAYWLSPAEDHPVMVAWRGR